MKLSERGVALIARFEGFRSRPYRDAVGVWTIGYGSTKGVGPNTPPISERAARARMKREVDAVYGAAVNRLGVPLNQAQFDALTSFVYNVGPGGISPSTRVGRALRARKYRDAADAMLEWNKGGGRVLQGLVNRRKAERALFLSAPPEPTRREKWQASLTRWRAALTRAKHPGQRAAVRRNIATLKRLIARKP